MYSTTCAVVNSSEVAHVQVKGLSKTEVKGQIRFEHLLFIHQVKFLIHRHREHILPKTNPTCKNNTQINSN